MERYGLTLRRLMPTDDQGNPRTARWICKVTGHYWGRLTHWQYNAFEGATASEAVEKAVENMRKAHEISTLA